MLNLELNNKTYLIPENADELSLGRYDNIRLLIDRKTISGITSPWSYQDILEVINYMTDIPSEILSEAPITFFELIFSKIEWVFSFNLDSYKPEPWIDWNGERYSYEPTEDWKLKEWVDYDTIAKDFPVIDKFAAFLAVKVRKIKKGNKGEYLNEIEDYHPNLISERKTLFKEMPISKLAPLLAFFLLKEKMFQANLELYSQELGKALHNHQVLSDWVISGDGSKQLQAWRKTIFLNWMKFLNEELSKHLTFYHTLSTNPTLNPMQLSINNN